MIHYARRDRAAIASLAERLLTLSTADGYLLWAAHGRIYGGWLQTMDGDAEAGIAEMRCGLERLPPHRLGDHDAAVLPDEGGGAAHGVASG